MDSRNPTELTFYGLTSGSQAGLCLTGARENYQWLGPQLKLTEIFEGGTRLTVILKLSMCVCCVFSCSVMSDSFVTLWTVAHQAPLSMGLPRQEHLSGVPFPSPGDLPNQGIKPSSPSLADQFFTTKSALKPFLLLITYIITLFLEWVGFLC